MITRRQFQLSTLALPVCAVVGSGCQSRSSSAEYLALVAETWRTGSRPVSRGMALSQELVRNATLAPSSHNTQCWKFGIGDTTITLLPDLSRRCPAVDPDNHHLFVSLGCATENLVQAALAYGLHADANYTETPNTIRVTLAPTRARNSPLFEAIAQRQCTRGDYDGKALTNEELSLLLQAGRSDGVDLLLLTDQPSMDLVLDHMVAANTVQMADPEFVRELRDWIRFNASQAMATRDGLYSLTSGNPAIPGWVGMLAFGMVFTPQTENDKIARQMRSSAGVAVFTGQAEDKAHWIDVGRCYERFALQATALGIRNAMLNQPVEVPSTRASFASAIGLGQRRPDLVVRFGRGPRMPSSLRRPLQAVLV